MNEVVTAPPLVSEQFQVFFEVMRAHYAKALLNFEETRYSFVLSPSTFFNAINSFACDVLPFAAVP